MRELLVAELAKEVLGPREGINEILHSSPLNEYITGVLAPEVVVTVPEIESDAELPTEDTMIHEEDTTDEDVETPPLFSPALNPKNRPTTMGLSFVVESPGVPRIRVCLTWSRYELFRGENDQSCWRRVPRSKVITLELGSNHVLNFDRSGTAVSDAHAEVSLNALVRPENRRYIVTLFLMNKIRVSSSEIVTSEDHIFQPQIRVVCIDGTQIVDSGRKPEGLEERTLEFLYRERKVLARGHLTSVVWREIDPEISGPVFADNTQAVPLPADPPFTWVDGHQPGISEEDRRVFSAADVRTEFVPMYSVPSPDLRWNSSFGRAPELRADVLAECWEAEELRNRLSPLINGYTSWVHSLRDRLSEMTGSRDVGENIVHDCETVLNRMSSGLEILCGDPDARLAFCFANKAMDQQARWPPRRNALIWYPYQLAYILMCIESVTNPSSRFRSVCDLVWIPTGAGKTEAYMGLMAFTMALRRRREIMKGHPSDGVSVITRYTLRLLTIQQFRRTLSLIASCEILRVSNLSSQIRIGWRPAAFLGDENFLWGSSSFSAGLWVGGGVTPNRLHSIHTRDGTIPGALELLERGGDREWGEPAQVLKCPSCETILAVPEMGLRPGRHRLSLVVRRTNPSADTAQHLSRLVPSTIFGVRVVEASAVRQGRSASYETINFVIEADHALDSQSVDSVWNRIRQQLSQAGCNLELVPARASRPGYFIRWYYGIKQQRVNIDFEIFCPNPDPNACQLHRIWCGGAPMGWICQVGAGLISPSNSAQNISLTDGNCFVHVPEAFRSGDSYFSDRIPIMALTVDEQIYQRPPSIIVATVDKFARPPFEARASSIFGNVEFHHSVWGFYRQGLHPKANESGHPAPTGKAQRTYIAIPQRPPPDLIVQDELHLIEGPLGSLVGAYETAVDYLCSERAGNPIKYLSSTATIRRAREQIQAVFVRDVQVFPPPGLVSDDRFFIRESEANPLLDTSPGRLYVGVCAPGKGPLTPLVRIWSRLLQTAWTLRNDPAVDRFWTLTGYFNAVRELAGARALYRQDIPLRRDEIAGGQPRPLPDERSVELSSRSSSTDLPSILDLLSTPGTDAPDALFTTSMFGTGVDIARIGLMVVNGQPKTTSSYIQSTGRVGRNSGALVVTFFRAARPRDLSHYEFFCGYHRQLHRFVEPVTVYPFSPNAIERVGGTVSVFALRNSGRSSIPWYSETSAPRMALERTRAAEVVGLPEIFEARSQLQPLMRRPVPGFVRGRIASKLDRWQSFASAHADLEYVEWAISSTPKLPVVLGDPQHRYARLPVVYENAPQSLRDIEETTGFQT